MAASHSLKFLRDATVQFSALLVLIGVVPPSQSAEKSVPVIDFVRDIRPIFESHCYPCHGPKAQESNYRLDRKDLALGKGDRDEAPIVPGKSGESPLIRFVSGADSDVKMPPSDEAPSLSEGQVALLRQWIEEGAAWPDGIDESANEPIKTDHWSFQPIADIRPPLLDEVWVHNGIDGFILAKLREAGLTPSPPADRISLVRRLYFDMHGLPPTPEQVTAFVSDTRPDAYARLVEEVLASPRYGERWAQHWLDVVRFAESNGFETNVERNGAWPYRDYVIEAFNSDIPYVRFLAEQLAGDALGEPAATGFLVAGAWDKVKSPDVGLTLMQRQDELSDMTNTTGTTFLGLTVGCARCHNHKFDPITQKDYFALQAIFAGVQHGERPFAPFRNAQDTEGLRPSVSPTTNEEQFPDVVAKAVRFVIRATNNHIEPCLDELEVWSVPVETEEPALNVGLAELGSQLSSSGNYSGNGKHLLAHINDGKYGNDWSWISDKSDTGWVRIDFAEPTLISRVTWGRDRLGGYSDRVPTDYSVEVLCLDGAWREVASSADRKPAPATWQLVYAGIFTQPVEPTRRLFRGDPMAPKEIVAPDVLTVMGTLRMAADAPEQQRRLALADWLASPSNPLTPRVMVNRIWQYHFGVGLVDTSSDFGRNGSRPTHPELLDWLARKFVQNGWSVKDIHRLILSSNAYQQSSWPRSECVVADADCRLLWRFPPRRLEAEVIHDSTLQITGVLELTMGGPGWRAFQPNDNYVRVYEPKREFGPAEWRRMVYMQRIRMRTEGVFGVFDSPDGGQVCPKRTRSTTAIQALNLFNSDFTFQQADLFAKRLRSDAGEEAEDQIERAFELAFSRQPDAEERHAAQQVIAAYGLNTFCRSMLNANELLFTP